MPHPNTPDPGTWPTRAIDATEAQAKAVESGVPERLGPFKLLKALGHGAWAWSSWPRTPSSAGGRPSR
jgi:hypothetical protein